MVFLPFCFNVIPLKNYLMSFPSQHYLNISIRWDSLDVGPFSPPLISTIPCYQHKRGVAVEGAIKAPIYHCSTIASGIGNQPSFVTFKESDIFLILPVPNGMEPKRVIKAVLSFGSHYRSVPVPHLSDGFSPWYRFSSYPSIILEAPLPIIL